MAARSLQSKPEALDAIRARLGLTLEEFADLAGCSSRTMDNVMAGKPALHGTFKLMASKLGVPVNEICESVASDEMTEGDTYSVRFRLNVPYEDFNQDRLQIFIDLLARLVGGSILDAEFTKGSTLVTVQLSDQQIRNLLDLLPDFRAKVREVLNRTIATRTLPEQLSLQRHEYPLADAVIDVAFPEDAPAIPNAARGQIFAVTG